MGCGMVNAMTLRVISDRYRYAEVYNTDQNESGDEYIVERRFCNFDKDSDFYRLNRNANEADFDTYGSLVGCNNDYCNFHCVGRSATKHLSLVKNLSGTDKMLGSEI